MNGLLIALIVMIWVGSGLVAWLSRRDNVPNRKRWISVQLASNILVTTAGYYYLTGS